MTFSPDSRLVARIVSSPNVEPRRGMAPSLLILHYTGLATVERAIEVLSDPRCKVSCHYVIDEAGGVIQMVPESLRAWHAGVAVWAGESDINSASIGIEIHNPGHALGYPDFPAAQMRAVRDLARDIAARHKLAPQAVLAHSDVAPSRKSDPGEKFDWAWLAAEGVGHWVRPEPLADGGPSLGLGDSGAAVARVQGLLAHYGYGIPAGGVLDPDTEFVVRAFQRHFRPQCVDGRIDRSTERTLERLVAALPPRKPVL